MLTFVSDKKEAETVMVKEEEKEVTEKREIEKVIFPTT